MRGIERRMAASVLLVMVFGIAWSIAAQDWQWFERSGALIILVAIGFVWLDHISLVGDVEKLYGEQYQALLDQLRPRPTGIIAGAMHDGKRERIEAAQMTLAEMGDLLRKRIRTAEAVTLGIGTMVLGYGAPLGKYLCGFR